MAILSTDPCWKIKKTVLGIFALFGIICCVITYAYFRGMDRNFRYQCYATLKRAQKSFTEHGIVTNVLPRKVLVFPYATNVLVNGHRYESTIGITWNGIYPTGPYMVATKQGVTIVFDQNGNPSISEFDVKFRGVPDK